MADDPASIVGNIAQLAVRVLCKMSESNDLKDSLEELEKIIGDVQRVMTTTASEVEGNVLKEPDAIVALQGVLESLEMCLEQVTNFASMDGASRFLLSGVYLAGFKSFASRLALSLSSLQRELGLQQQQEGHAAGGLCEEYCGLIKRLEELELNVLYFMAERVESLKTELLMAARFTRSSSSGSGSGGSGGGCGVDDSAVTAVQRHAILKALVEAGVVGPQALSADGMPTEDVQRVVQELGRSLSVAINAELERMDDDQGDLLEAAGFLVTVAHALTSLPPPSPPAPPAPAQARDGDGDESVAVPPAAAAAAQQQQTQPAEAAAAAAPVAEAAAGGPATPPQQGAAGAGGAARVLSVPSSFVCPITMMVMRDPVMLVESGHTFEREVIEAYLEDNDKNPLTNLRLSCKTVAPNIGLRGAIEEWLSEHGLTAEQADDLEPGGGPPRPPPPAAAAAEAPAAAAAAAPATPEQVVPDRRARRDVTKRLATATNEIGLLDASRAGNKDLVVELLQDMNLSPNVQDQEGCAPLHLASQNGHKAVVQVLLAAGADVAAREEVDANTALHLASKNGHAEVVAVLLDAGANVEARTPDGETALHMASLMKHEQVVRILLAASGGDTAARNQWVVGSSVAIRYVSIDDAQSIQADHGDWAPSMERMLGKTGTVVAVLANGDVSVQMDDGSGTKRWNPVLLLPAGTPTVMSPPSSLSSLRMGRSVTVDGKYTVRYINNEPNHVGAVQADFPAPPSSLVYYFEMKIADAGADARIGLGFAHSGHSNTRHVGWDEGSFGLHGDDGNAFWENGRGDYYGFKYGTGDVVGAALDFQRKQIFFTKNGCPGKALPVKYDDPLYPTVSLRSSGAVVSVNFGQSPFVFDIEPYKIKVGGRVAIRYVCIDEAKANQEDHGGWVPSMEEMLGKTGEVKGIDEEGDVLVEMDDDGDSNWWNPTLVASWSSSPQEMTPPSRLSSRRIGEALEVIEDGDCIVRYAAVDDGFSDFADVKVGGVQAEFPAPPSSLIYYFEVKIVDAGVMGGIGLGYANSSYSTQRHVGWDYGSFGFHGDVGNVFWQTDRCGSDDYYGFKYGTGDVVGAALDFQRKQIFFTKNGFKGKSLSFSFNDPLYPTVSLRGPGEVVVNFGQKPFVFDIEPYKIMVGRKVVIRNVAVEAAKAFQRGHGGWDDPMELMLGTRGTVEYIDSDGDVRVEMDGGGGCSFLWNPVLVLPSPPLSPGDKVTIRALSVSEAQAAQVGHGGWARSMEKMLGKTGVVESVGKGGDVRVKMDVGGDSKLWNPEMVLRGCVKPTASLSVGAKVTIKKVALEDAKLAQVGHGGWNTHMEKHLGKPGVVVKVHDNGDVKVRFDNGDEFYWCLGLVEGATTSTTTTAAGSAAAGGGGTGGAIK